MRSSLQLALALALAVPLAAQAAEPPPGDGPWVVRVPFQTKQQVDQVAAETEPWEVHYDKGYLVVGVDRGGWLRLLALGLEPELDAALTAEMLRPHALLPGQVAGIPGYPCYRTVEETYASALQIVTDHPTLASWADVGDSWDKQEAGGPPGYDMMILRLTNSAIPGPKPKLMITAAIHAREYATAELVTRFAEYLVNGYATDPDSTWILDHQEVHLMLQTNPDGRKQAETGQLWRKNVDNNYCSNTSSRGADLNRNFPYQWGCCGGSSGSTCSETYRGPSAGSEPETQSVRDYALANFPDYGPPSPPDAAGLYLDIHSYSELVLWPWGYTSGAAPNATALQTLGRKFAYFNLYYPEQSWWLYVTDGATDDDVYGELGVAAYTFEIGTAFFQDCATFTNTILPTNMQALLYAARVTRAPYMLASGPDALSVATVPAGSVGSGQPLEVHATVNDTRYNNSNGAEPTQSIAAAEVYVDTPPWAPGATPIPLAASDGNFNQTIEPVQGTLSTAAWSTGRHTLYVRGRDAANNWGPVGAVFIDVVVPVELLGFSVE